MSSLRSIVLPPTSGKASPAPAGSLFPLEVIPSGPVTLAGLLKTFPAIPPRLLVTLAVLPICDESVSPWRLCYCGCGATVTGKATLASAACRKRVQRERDAARAASGDRQYQIPLQAALGSPLPPPKQL